MKSTAFANLPLAHRAQEWDPAAALLRAQAFTSSDGSGKPETIDKTRFAQFFFCSGDKENEVDFFAQFADVVDGEIVAIPKAIIETAKELQAQDADGLRAHMSKYFKKMSSEFRDPSIEVPWKQAARIAIAGGKIKLLLDATKVDFKIQLSGEAKDGKQPFVATVTFGGMASDHPVGGTENLPGGPYRVYIPRDLLSMKIDELPGKSAFAAESLETHDGGKPVGQFSDAWCEDIIGGMQYSAAKASGFFDTTGKNAELVAKIIDAARHGEAGFSYDLKDSAFRYNSNVLYGETVVELTDFEWRGATVLKRSAAAYSMTQLAAAKSKSSQKEQIDMDEAKLKELLAAALAPLTTLNTSISSIDEKIKGLDTRMAAIEAGKPGGAPAKGTEMNIADFAKTITDSVKSGIADGLKAAGIKPEEGNERRTFSASQIDVVRRFTEGEDKDNPESLESIEAAIMKVQESTVIRQHQKEATLQTLGAMKRAIQRQQIRMQQSGGVA